MDNTAWSPPFEDNPNSSHQECISALGCDIKPVNYCESIKGKHWNATGSCGRLCCFNAICRYNSRFRNCFRYQLSSLLHLSLVPRLPHIKIEKACHRPSSSALNQFPSSSPCSTLSPPKSSPIHNTTQPTKLPHFLPSLCLNDTADF